MNLLLLDWNAITSPKETEEVVCFSSPPPPCMVGWEVQSTWCELHQAEMLLPMNLEGLKLKIEG